MSTIGPVSNSEPAAALAAPAAQASSQTASRAGASAVQPADRITRQPSSDTRDVLRQSEAIERMRAELSANARTRLQIERDEDKNGRFIYRLLDPDTGETLRRWPPDKFGDLISFLGGKDQGLLNERV